MYARCTVKILSGMANSVNFMSQDLWLVEREKRMLIYNYNKGTEQQKSKV